MDAERTGTGDDWLLAPYRWKRLFRIPTGLLIVAAGWALAYWLIGGGKQEWVGLLLGASVALWGATIAWEVTLACIAILGCLFAWDWYRGLSDTAQTTTFLFIMFVVGLYIESKRSDARFSHLERRITGLESQLRNRQGDRDRY